jgi:Na+/melibiose symporter-like transporter
VLAFAAIAMTMTVYGQTPGVAVFVNAVIADLGLDRGEVSAAYAVGSLASAFLLPWIGRRLDLVGVRTMTILIAVGFGLAMVVLAGAQGILWLAVGFAGIRLFGQGALGLAGRNAVTLHFRVGLGRAVAISGSIAAIVSSAVPFVLAAIIAGVGWRETWLAAAISVGVVVIPATLVLLPRRDAAAVPADAAQAAAVPAEAVPADLAPADVLPAGGGDAAAPSPGSVARPPAEASTGATWTRARAIRSRMFWLITLANAAAAVILTGFAFHQISVLGEAGLSAEAAAAMFVPLTIASVGFLAIVAPLAGRWASRTILAGAMAPLVIAMLLVPFLGGPLVPVVYACALGAALGAGQVLDGILYPRHFGVHAIGAIRGAAFTVVATASAAGPVIVDVLHGLTGSYVVAAVLLATLPAAVVGAAFVLREPSAAED